MDDRKFLWDSSVHNFENHANCFWGNQKCTWAKIPSFAKNYNRNAKKKGFRIWGEVWHDSSLWMYWWYMYPSKNSSCKLTRLFNYKQYFPHVQAICDSTVQAIYDRKGYFMDVECKWLGSVHDMKGFANSVVCKNIRSNNLPQRSYNILSGYESLSNYIVGYPSYPVTPYCIMKKIQYWVENKQVIFNNMLRRARNQI